MNITQIIGYTIGIPTNILCPNESKNGEITIVNGKSIIIDEYNTPFNIIKYFSELGLDCNGSNNDFFNGVVGKNFGESEYTDILETISLPIFCASGSKYGSNLRKEIKKKIKEVKFLFQKYKFPQDIINKVDIFMVIDYDYKQNSYIRNVRN